MKKQTKLGLVLAAAAVISVSVASLVSARGWVQNGADWYYVDNNNEYVTDTIQSSGNSKFYLGEDGRMERDYFLESWGDGENTYYFGQNGAMVTNTWVAIESSRVENQGDYVPDNYWYYFQASGKAMKGNNTKCKRTTIDGKKYAFNEYGQMCTGWFKDNGEVINPDDETNPFKEASYYAGGDNDGVLRAGWVTYYDGYDGTGSNEPWEDYDNLYFYFNTSNNRKYGIDSDGGPEWVYKKINGRSYAFTNEGIMLSGWNADDYKTNFDSISDKTTYFSGQDDGHQVKKGWVYAVPSYDIDSEKYYDDEEVYMYFLSSGDITKDQFKKVNGKYYVFDTKGVMKSGVIIWSAAGVNNTGYHYVSKLDMDYAEGSNVAKKGILQIGGTKYIKVSEAGKVVGTLQTDSTEPATDPSGILTSIRGGNPEFVKLHYYGSDGARKTGANSVEFADDTYTLQTTGSNGDKGSGSFSKKYYALGVQLKATSDIRYGIYTVATYNDPYYNGPAGYTDGALIPEYAGWFAPQSQGANDKRNWFYNLEQDHYLVLNTSGSKQKGSNQAKKDADGNYWLIDSQTGYLRGIWTVNVNGSKSFGTSFYTRAVSNDTLKIATTTNTYQDLIDCGLAMNVGGDVVNTEWRSYLIDKRTGKATTDPNGGGNGTNIYFAPIKTYNLPAFATDYEEKSNKWIPMGLLDNAKKTVSVVQTAVMDSTSAAHAYDVTPTNDYFLNCYWSDGANDINLKNWQN